jgi:hypothetical protein
VSVTDIDQAVAAYDKARAYYAALSRRRKTDDPVLIAARSELAAAKRDLEAERLAEYVREVVAKAPPLSQAQKDKISAIVHGHRAERAGKRVGVK